MKAIRKHLRKFTAIFLLTLIIQSCSVYKSKQISLDEAISLENKVKVVTMSDEYLRFKRIGKDGNAYYGLKKRKGVLERVPLNPNFVKSVKEKDKTTSTVLTVLVPIGILVGLGYALGAFEPWDISFEDSDFRF